MTSVPIGAPTARPSRPRRPNAEVAARHRRTRLAGAALRLALVAGGLAVAVLWWADPHGSSVAGPGGWWTAAGRLAGLGAAYTVLLQVLLMARLPWFERAVGHDRLTAWHRILGTGVLTLIAAHVLAICWGYSLADRHPLARESWTILATYPDMVLAAIGTGLFVAVAVTSGRLARHRLSYEAWWVVHLGAYLAVALTFFHQVANGADFIDDPAARILWIGLYASVGASVAWWRLICPVRAWSRHRLRVVRIVREADEVISVWVSGRHLGELDARAGQYFLWRFAAHRHLLTAHPYSLSAMPTDRSMRITVRAVGDHSGDLARLRPGTRVLAEGPFGTFTGDRRSRRRVLLIAGGSGIAPIRALLEELQGVPGTDVVVLYRTTRRADLALWAELEAFHDQRLATVHYLVGSRHQLGHDPLEAHRLLGLVPDVAWRDVYICGPVGMTDRVVRSLEAIGVSRTQVHTEGFALR